jgi:hypothetical protein
MRNRAYARVLRYTGKLKTEDLVRPYSGAGYSILHRAILAKQPWNWYADNAFFILHSAFFVLCSSFVIPGMH